MRKFIYGAMTITLALSAAVPAFTAQTTEIPIESQISSEETAIELSDSQIVVNGETASKDTSSAVYTSNDIIYYEDKDTYDSGNQYGEGTSSEKHTSEEAAKHTVVNITKPGTYHISGKLSYGQIFVNVGKEEADKVTLILDNVDINCTVAPAVFFYNVYECDTDAAEETASNIVDTTQAGAKVIIADQSINNITGSHVAKIYKDNTDAKKLHKYDGAFYSRMSMEITGESIGNGVLNITSDNEGLDSEMHLTINGGNINIKSADDGINVNEDNISVFTMNGGNLNIYAGLGSEGDGIDSNGWIEINGGTVVSLANPKSPDGGIDSDMGTRINGGVVIGAGNMYDALEDSSKQNFMFLELSEATDEMIVITDKNDNPLIAYDLPYKYTYLSLSMPSLSEGTYHVYKGGKITGIQSNGIYTNIISYEKGTQLHHGGTSSNTNSAMMNKPNGGFGLGERPELPEGIKEMNGLERPERPEGMEGKEPPAKPEGVTGHGGPRGMQSSGNAETYEFVLTSSNREFTNVASYSIDVTNTPESNKNTSTAHKFTDVSSTDWYAQAVEFCSNKGLMAGTSATEFSPSATMTREMFVTIIYRLAGSPEVSNTSHFTDLSNPSAYYYNAVLWANKVGITKGISSTSFGVGKAITLQNAMTMLERYGKGNSLTTVTGDSKPATRAQIANLLMEYCK